MAPTIRLRTRRAAVALATAVFVIAGALLAVTLPNQAEAQSGPVPTGELTEVTGFGSNPGDLQMYVYVPDAVQPDAPLLVGVHWCTGSGPDFYNGTPYAQLAEEHGFIVLYPSVTRESKCFDVASPEALTRGGGSDPVSIKSMIDWVESNYTIDAERRFVTGVSSGAMMTNVLLGLYPDVFAAGSAFAGVPFGCFATTDGSEWNSQCSEGEIIRTPQEWGDLVRNAYPGFTGERPRMQTWHGTEDDALRYPNFGEQIKQWTNVHGVSQTPSFSDRPRSNWERTRYGGTDSQAPVEAISVEDVGHNVITGEMIPYVVEFFGLDDPAEDPTDPTSEPTDPTDPTSEPTTDPPDGDCSATVDVVSDWGSGWQANVNVTAGAESIGGWTLTWTWPGGQTITSSWNADVSASGSTVTAGDAGWNGEVAAGETRNAWGFIASGPAVAPDVTCSAG
ncbi:PHB depolymerase family esterase [Glycomyces sp. L485]|uniref:extracellular catalytic domain type 1 short-chain-length polyhydroxyalkanoate depolymerase n=1 Tax=Glycomyces sp. L485 TaxID=2909235 RepID=UPI001F4BA0BB|nr:PHB depolymerase family esterase [Glycomyces sp. L485]MCH7232808.1 PHB depolymerase family esterase [Glycomyces sp. L485]